MNWFIGTGIFASLCFEGLIRRNISFSKIITGQPTRSGRNGKTQPSPVELKAIELGLTATRTGKLTDNHELIRDLEAAQPEYIFVIDFGQIIREPFLSYMCLNIHPSLLPKYRGAAPIQRALLNGENFTGVSLFRLAKAMDAGDIIAQAETPITPDDNASDLYVRLAALGCDIAAKSLAHGLTFTPQDDSLATVAPKIEKHEHEVSFMMTAETFSNTVRALDMSGGAFVVVRGKRLKLWRVRVRPDMKAATCGQVMGIDGGVIVSCCDGCVELLEVQSEGKNRTGGLEWARGIRLKAGDVLQAV